MITASVDTSRLNDALAALHDALLGSGQDAANVVRDETKRLIRTIVNFTPPLKSTAGNAKASGDRALARGINSLFSEFETGAISDIAAGQTRSVNQWRTVNGQPVHFDWKYVDAQGSQLKEFHHQWRENGTINTRRTSRLKSGGPQDWKALVVVPVGARANYLREQLARVGRWKASWAKTAADAAVGDKFPAWITRHFGGVSAIAITNTAGLSNPQKPSVTFGSRAPGVGKTEQRIRSAMKFRAQAISRRVKLVLSGYAQDVSHGIKARARAKQNPQPVEVVE